MSRGSTKLIKELTKAVTQHNATIPPGYTFDPRRTPPLFKTPAPVAIELQKDGNEESMKTPPGGDGGGEAS